MNEVRTITPPATELLTTAQAKAFLKIDHTDEDELINLLITTTREMIERHCGISIGEQTKEWVTDFSQAGPPKLGKYLPRRNCYEVLSSGEAIPYPPFIELVSAERWNETAYETQTETDDFTVLEGYFDPLQSGTWKITYTAGYDADTLPAGLKLIWRQYITYAYTHRQDEDVPFPGFIKYALQPYIKRSLI
ncbi:MAG TPA: head-tail connector protein [Flavisolibacter sp.]|nr:head-tail connector protein [Flavisolibacter sp.]